MKRGLAYIGSGALIVAAALVAGHWLGMQSRADKEAVAILGLAVVLMGVFRVLRSWNVPALASAAIAALVAGAGVWAVLAPGAASSGEGGQPPLLAAIARGDEGHAARLIEGGADVNEGSSNTTPLILACDRGSRSLVELLLQHRADPNRPAPRGMTPLAAAVVRGDLDIARALLAAGADPTMGTPYGSPLTLAEESSEMRKLLVRAGAPWGGGR